MRRWMHQHFAMTLACYVAAWLSIAPTLVICVCHQGEASVVVRDHDEPACDTHRHNHNHPEPPGQNDGGEEPNEHTDQPIMVDDVLVNRATDLVFVTLPLSVLTSIQADTPAWTDAQRFSVTPLDGPPRAVHLALASIILLT